ncbi:MAG: type I glyceraldehyde-3-phosphate dehydrogenase [Candidatus Taylorbacteria bacterium RIFCSPLOWO2_01_FULL_43_44]|uniref:Type I glyceraldehyde-3-phosphate dehydrogenase n=1 Tax=Candidatus Taylorbacteria bacterium RIFCSPHIGHO2_02_FULL_43_32b TaxID=1802306 RepID=A0A1G2MK13_9BACT|nr:MAG: type I glyceraldehyde-3-phosphate dehydrogenase [Candidatus Taylorbacteria bacterium RIFCSPHIGHO2_01_FULL_43_47]OHA24270.1 MAG: type I glyceraldehyde-3-phosphate dehydrogenase [Candidatus Taylorbacteria bacterium RIFCSPHIGHO2_02_FULL_43_32b]OHA31387.1 MAG: type I glyceraldehyde-3-phosphate dehydrogenase [Candidatus Taylorbacteria bacterium RIFCSPLOWO2_01_FULL_43_44]
MKIAINGCGRIGRAFIRVIQKTPEIELVAINDLGSIQSIAYLLKFDSVYRVAPFSVSVKDDKTLTINGKDVAFISEKDPAKLPWKNKGIDVVVESTGLFTTFEKAKAHIDAGARKVVISAPAKSEGSDVKGETVLLGINEDKLKTCNISSNASCTTNAASPLLAILDEALGVEKAILNTVHGYTASQALVDGPSKKDLREGRAAAQNIVPSSTGAAIATTKALPQLEKKFDGISIRVPVVVGSIVDVTFIAKRNTTKEEVNEILKKAAADPRWKNIFAITDEPLVSSDIIGSPFASIADLEMTRVVDGNLVKVLGWYDNEMGYTHTLVEHVIKSGRLV